jgi:integrase
MGIQKRRNAWEVYAYDPAIRRKRYVGRRKLKRDAETLFAAKREEFRAGGAPHSYTLAQYADRWLEYKHGENTKRPAPTTHQVNRGNLKRFLAEYGDRRLIGGIKRHEALDWSLRHGIAAKTVSAMYNDAIDDGLAVENPFRNRRQAQGRGRQDIEPITEAEVSKLGEIALEHWGDYGRICKAWIFFSAWVGSRPSETFAVRWEDLDFKRGEATIRRVKGRKQTDVVVFPVAAQQAILDMPRKAQGLVFTTVGGKPINKGASRYYWDPVRKTFAAQLDERRRDALLHGRPDLDLYELRHFCGSVMADRGLSEFDISAQLGNTPDVCRKHYIHVYRDRVNDRVRMALDQDPRVVVPIRKAQ